MRIHIITIGEPKLAYAKLGWQEYMSRLGHYHTVRTTHIADKNNDSDHILQAIGQSYAVGLVIEGKQLSSAELATFIETRNQSGHEVSFIIGGPDGLPADVIARCDYRFSFSRLTLPHDLAMVVLLETLYRSSTIVAGQPYHR